MPSLAAPDAGQRHDGVEWFVNSPVHIVWAGGQAVIVLFALSEIVPTLPILRARRFDWLAYFPARLLRLYLPVIASVLIPAHPRDHAGIVRTRFPFPVERSP